jgi:DNA polymerase-3 subunit gamma/tau
MDYQVSARKYRPATFQDVIGQTHVVQTLMNAIASKRIAHAFLFSGTRGVGKTTVARILAKALNCEKGPTGTPCDTCPSCVEISQGTSVDVIEIDGASNTGVDDVREIRENVKFTAYRGGYRVYIIDEVHMLSNSAFNALLKTLEEPPSHVVFIFATTELHKIPATILSRCQHYNFRRIPRGEVIQRLRHVVEREGLAMEDRSLAALARAAEGSMRDALSLLDQVVAFGGQSVRHEDLEALLGAVPHEFVRRMIRAVIAQDSPEAVRVVAQVVDQGHDLKVYCADLVEHVRHMLIASVVSAPQDLAALVEGSEEDRRQIVEDARACSAEPIQELFRIFTQAEEAMKTSPHARFVLEAAAVRATRVQKLAAPVIPARSERPAGQGTGAQPASPAKSAQEARGDKAPAAGDSSGQPQGSRPSAKPPATPKASPVGRSAGGTPPPTLDRPAASAPPLPAGPPAGGTASVPADGRPSRRTLAELDWDRILERVEQVQPSVAPFLAAGHLLSLEDECVMVGYPRTASVALSRLQGTDVQRAIADICSDVIGQRVRIGVVELADGQAAPPSMAEARAAKLQEEKRRLLDKARAHPLVKQALTMFGGDVVDIEVTSAEKEQEP